MHPILLQAGGLKLYTYGLFVALGFITAIWFTKRNAKFYGVPDQMVSDLFFTILFSALAGARILYVLIGIIFLISLKSGTGVWFFSGALSAEPLGRLYSCVSKKWISGKPLMFWPPALL